MSQLEEHAARVLSLTFDATGQLLASGGKDGAILLGDIETGSCVKTQRDDRRYEGVNITGVTGLTPVEKAKLKVLGAIE